MLPLLHKAPSFLHKFHPLYKIPIIYIISLYTSPHFLPHFTKREIPLLPPPNPNPKNSPKLFHLHLKTSRIHQGLHQRTPPSTTTSRSTSSTSSFNIYSWIEAIIFSLGSSFKLNPFSEYLTHQDLDNSSYTCDGNPCTLIL